MRHIGVRLSFSAILSILLACSLPGLSFGADVHRATLKNGLRVVIVPNRLAPVVTTELNYLVGSNEAPEGFPGMAHAQEHMMFRGSPDLSAGQLANIMAAMGGEFNADTQQTVTQYFGTVPAEDLDVILHMEALRMEGILDSQSLWDKERGAIEQEVAQDLSNPMYIFYARLLAHMFTGTPYAHDALGTKPSFDKTTAAMLKSFHETWYTPNNAILVIVGDVDPAETLKMVNRLFGGIPSRPVPPRPKIELKPLTASTIDMDTDLSYGMAMIAFRLPGFESPDFAAGIILADVLNSHRGDLYAMVPQGLALSAGFSVEPVPAAAMGLATATFPKGGDGKAQIIRMKAAMAGYLKNGIPADLVEAAKRGEIASYEFSKNSVAGLAALWSQALAVEGRNSPEEDIEAVRKVTVADVNRVARTYLDMKTATTAVLTPRPAGAPAAVKPFRGKESFAPQEVKAVVLPQWAQKVKVARIPPAPPAPADLHLSNGLRLIVLPLSISPTVSLYGKIQNTPALEVPKGKEGADTILKALFSYGTKNLDRLAFEKAQDDIAAQVSAGTSFSLQVPVDGLDRGMELLADNMLHPALPEAAFKVVRQETAGALSGELQSPSYLARRSLEAALYPPGDPSLRQATPETVSALSLDDIRAYYRQVFRPDMTTVVVLGQISPDKAQALVGKYFGIWRAQGPKPKVDLPPVPLNKPSAQVVPDPSRVQDAVVLAETLGINRSHPDYYPLQVGENVLSGSFYATRLSRDLREETGLVYAVEAVLEADKTRAAFTVFYACDPANVSKARSIVEQNLTTMQKTPVSPTELQQAKTLLLRRILLERANVATIAAQWLSLVDEGLPLNEPQHAARRFEETTADQVQKAYMKWIRPGDFAQVTLGPTPK